MTLPKKEVLALIPARGGSKSIPRKNLIKILGKPLIIWTIELAKKSELINRIIVSTDDEEIAKVALDNGAEVPFIRPSKYAEDQSTDIDVFRHCLKWLKSNENYQPEIIAHLRPTGPARDINLIDLAIKKILHNPKAHSLRSISLASQTPFKMWFLDEDKEFMNPVIKLKDCSESHSLPRQILPKAYWQNGYIDIIRSGTILNLKSMVGKCSIPFIINHMVHDLDYIEDIPYVEKALKRIIDKKNNNEDIINEDRHPV